MPMVHDHHVPRGAGGQQFRALLGASDRIDEYACGLSLQLLNSLNLIPKTISLRIDSLSMLDHVDVRGLILSY